MIQESWFKERLDTTDPGEIFRRELLGYRLSDAGLKKLLAEGPSPQWVEKWKAFIGQAVSGDEV